MVSGTGFEEGRMKPKEKVVSIAHRFEKWSTPFECDNLTASVSTHGRIKLKIGNEMTVLSFMEAASFLGRVSEVMEKEMSVDTFAGG